MCVEIEKINTECVSYRNMIQGKKADLYNVGRFIRVLLEDEHGRSVRVDVVLLEQVSRLRQTLIHVAKLHIVFISKRGQLWRNSSQRSHLTTHTISNRVST